MTKENKQFSYKDSGVDIDAGNELVKRIKSKVASTFSSSVLTDIGGFGALFELDKGAYENPVLVSSTDGVGTKLKVAFMCDKHDTVGIDLVAMCVNDIIVQGAKPLFFLDYFATGKLETDKAEQVISGIVDGCKQANCSLIGGETAEMPSMYAVGEYDLAGFSVGVVDKNKVINGNNIKEGDVVIGVASSGVHSNGYSLVRKIIFEKQGMTVNDKFDDEKTFGDVLLEPTKIYVKPVLDILNKVEVKGIVHVTGGGFYENIVRVLPANTSAVIDGNSFPILPIFSYIQEKGNVTNKEMFTTFNMGIGFILVVDKKDVEVVQSLLAEHGEESYVVGNVCSGKKEVVIK